MLDELIERINGMPDNAGLFLATGNVRLVTDSRYGTVDKTPFLATDLKALATELASLRERLERYEAMFDSVGVVDIGISRFVKGLDGRWICGPDSYETVPDARDAWVAAQPDSRPQARGRPK